MPKSSSPVSKETKRRSVAGTSLFKSLRSSRQVPSSVQVAAAPHKGEGNSSNKKIMEEPGAIGEDERPADPKEAPTNNKSDETKFQKAAGKLKKRLGVVREDQAEEFFVDDSEEEDHDSTNNGMDDEEQQPPAYSTSAAATTQKGRRRRSAISLLHNAFGASNIRLRTEMDLIREKFADTYRREGNAVLLHGYLHIQIIRARNLRNADCFRGFHELCKCISTDVSDPYVTVHAGAHRLVKTPQIQDDLNPEWKLDFFVPVCHVMEGLEFRVKDRDEVGSELLGTTYLSVHELIRFPGHDNLDSSNNGVSLSLSHDFGQGTTGSDSDSVELLRTGVHKTVHLDNKPHHGSLEYFVEFIPKDMLHKVPRNRGLLTPKSRVSMVVPGVYFPLRTNNRLRLYINADDKGEVMGTPRVRYGTDNDEKLWKPRRFFRDVYDSICRAEHMVYLVGWSVDYTQSLLRGIEQTEGLNVSEDGTQYSPYIGELLNQKANEGVVVNMLVWDDQTSNAIKRVGVVATMDEQLRDYFRGSKVNLRLVPMVGGNTNMLKKFRNAVYYTHHQKCVICDIPKKDLVAYVGGVDLTYGRYDDGSYPLFRTLNTDHKSDFHNACAEVNPAMGPRQPWHDIHSRVEGLGALDLLQNFEERWIGQGGLTSDLVRLEDKGIKGQAHSVEDDEDAWNTQLFRSIDERTAKLKSPQYAATSFDEIKGVEFAEGKEIKGGRRRSMLEHILKTGKEREQHFVASANSEHGGGDTLEVARPLDIKRELRVDSSCHKALIHHIRNAQHAIYMESQYFLSSSYLWPEGKTDKCCNMVAAEITFKICEKIEAGERFAAYIVVPMWPEGLPDSSSVQDILAYQSYTMKAIYKRIAKSIERRRNKLEADGNQQQINEFEDVKPTDYLNFYCLANRETSEGTAKLSANELLNRTRRHLVYTHSKMTIVDDSIILVGSANINQRSLDGNRDSELLMGAWQPAHLATNDSVPNGDVHGFRMHCFAHLTGIMEDVFRKPSSLECVRRLNAIAADSWKMYTQDQVCDMTSHIVPYPIKVLPDGDLEPATANGRFPDTNARILGTPGSLPKFLTT